MKKLKEWLIKFLKQKLIEQYQRWLFKVKVIGFLLIGIFIITPYETYIMYPSIKYFGEWIRYVHMTIEGVALIFFGIWMFKHLKPKDEPVLEPVPVEEKQKEE